MIAGYQRWISPVKGYRCAHAVLHGGPGCSGFAQQAIRAHGLWRGLALLRERFRHCRQAMLTLNGEEELKRRQHKNRNDGRWFSWGDAAWCGAEGCCAGTKTVTETKAGFCGALGSFGAIGCCGN